MNFSLIKKLSASLLTMTLLGACSQGFDSLNSTAGNQGQGGVNDGQSPATPPPAQPSEFQKLDLNSYVAGGTYENEQVIALDKANNALLLYLPMPSMGSFFGINMDIPKLPGAKIKTVLDSQQKARVVVSIPLKYIVKNKVTTLPSATKLPGGRDLPMMPSGEYPSVALDINTGSSKTYLYLGVNAVGLYMESSFFPEYFSVTTQIRNSAKTRILGYLTIVPKLGPNNGGLFLSFLMPKDLATIIDNHLSGIIN